MLLLQFIVFKATRNLNLMFLLMLVIFCPFVTLVAHFFESSGLFYIHSICQHSLL